MNSKIYTFLFSIVLLFSLLFIQCTSTRPVSANKKYNVSKEDLLNAQFYFYRDKDTSSVVYMMFNTDVLLFARLDTGLQFYASVKIKVILNSLSNNSTDSVSQIFYIPKTQSTFFSYLNIRVKSDNYYAKISISDLNKKTTYNYYTEIKLDDDNQRNNFLATFNNQVLFKPYIIQGNYVEIFHRKKTPYLYVDVFKYNHSPAPPPFSNITTSLNYLPDSSFTISMSDNQKYLLKILPNQYYHIRTSQNNINGFTIFSIDSIFPNIKDSKEMLYTSRYIMNKNEFEKCNQLIEMEQTKKCLDNFWIQIAGSKERAKQLIKNYYQRVIDANQLFTSYKYGWQTDRGMIYIIFGPPEDIQKKFNTEKWYYSINGQRNALVFNFYKNKNNPFTTSDYILERSDYYKDIWYIAVDKIRQGILNTK